MCAGDVHIKAPSHQSVLSQQQPALLVSWHKSVIIRLCGCTGGPVDRERQTDRQLSQRQQITVSQGSFNDLHQE